MVAGGLVNGSEQGTLVASQLRAHSSHSELAGVHRGWFRRQLANHDLAFDHIPAVVPARGVSAETIPGRRREKDRSHSPSIP